MIEQIENEISKFKRLTGCAPRAIYLGFKTFDNLRVDADSRALTSWDGDRFTAFNIPVFIVNEKNHINVG